MFLRNALTFVLLHAATHRIGDEDHPLIAPQHFIATSVDGASYGHGADLSELYSIERNSYSNYQDKRFWFIKRSMIF